jgi:hypothetical protein
MRRLGVFVGRTDVAVVVIERGKTIWTAAVPLGSDPQITGPAHIASTLGSMLDRVPRYGWRAPRVDIALDQPWARIKLVKGVPSVGRKLELLSMLRLNTARFVASSRPVIITGANEIAPGEVQIGVADLRVVEAITHEIANRNLRVGRFVPAASFESVRLSSDAAPEGSDEREILLRQSIAARVTLAPESSQLGLLPKDNPAIVMPDASRGRIVLAGTALAATVLIYFGGQLHSERASLIRDRAYVRGIAALSDSGMQEKAELGSLNHDLANAARFSRHRVSMTALLGAITQALPAEAVITTIRVDTANVDIVTLSPRTAAVVGALSDVASVTAPTIIGPVSRETVGPAELERATIRMRLAPDYGRAKIGFKVERDDDQ